MMRIPEYVELRQSFALRAPGRMLRYEYERIAGELEECIACLDRGEIKINWYMQIAALDYAVLARNASGRDFRKHRGPLGKNKERCDRSSAQSGRYHRKVLSQGFGALKRLHLL
jgi:hypothetical protein